MSSKTSEIHIEVDLNENKIPEKITWKASDAGMVEPVDAKAMLLAFWDGKEKTAMRIDLWTESMMVDEMNDMFFQTMMTMADTYSRATGNDDLSEEFKHFAKAFYKKAQEKIN